MSDRLARIIYENVQPLTVYAEDGEMVAFKYDNGGYGWANRSSFVPLADAEATVAARREQREREALDSNLRARLRIEKEIRRVSGDLDRLTALLDNYPLPDSHPSPERSTDE